MGSIRKHRKRESANDSLYFYSNVYGESNSAPCEFGTRPYDNWQKRYGSNGVDLIDMCNWFKGPNYFWNENEAESFDAPFKI